jgi:hypothetical protein
MANCIYQPQDYPAAGGGGGGITSHRTWDALETSLAAASAGTVEELAGTGADRICLAVADGAGGVSVLGPLVFTNGDGTEFSIGAGLNIESTTVDPTLDASGVDVSLLAGGRIDLNFFKLNKYASHIQGVFAATVGVSVTGQAISLGNQHIYGGSYNNAGLWHRAGWAGIPPVRVSSVLGGTRVSPTPSGEHSVSADIVTTEYTSTDSVGVLLGSWVTAAFAPGAVNPGFAGTLSPFDMDAADRPVQIFCDGKGAVGWTLKLEKIHAIGGLIT